MTITSKESGPRADNTETATKKNTQFTDQGNAHSTGSKSNSVVTADFAENALGELDMLGAPLFLLRPWDHPEAIKGKYAAPSAWPKSKPENNGKVIDSWETGYGVGMVCGTVYDVIDVDPRNGGDESFDRMLADGLVPPVRRAVKTPSGGWHLYVDALSVAKAAPLPGIDYQARGAYVFTPPTEGYQEIKQDAWPATGNEAGRTRLLELVGRKVSTEREPGELYDGHELNARELAYLESAVQSAESTLRNASGARNHMLFSQGAAMGELVAGAGLDEDEVRERLWAAADEAPSDHGLTSTDSRSLDRGLEQGKDNPRALPEDLRSTPESDFGPLTGESPTGEPQGDSKAAEADKREQSVRAELERMVVREEARRRFSALNRVAPEMPDAVSLVDLLATELDAPRWRIEGLWPADARVNLVASPKAGKTTTVGNIVRSLADGEDFLGHAARPLGAGETAVLFDTEMSPLQLQDWYGDLDLTNPGKVRVVPLVGRATGLNFLDEDALRRLVPQYAGAHTYILDPVGPVLAGLGLDENSNSDVQRFLSAWDTFVTLMGGKESMIVHHAGHNAERARGASAFLGSGSAIWTLINKDPDDPASLRYIKAQGRDVGLPETQMLYDPFTRRLSLGTGSRAQNKKHDKISALADAVEKAVQDAPGLSAGQVRSKLRSEGITFQKGDDSRAAQLAVERGLAHTVQDGPNKRYYPGPG